MFQEEDFYEWINPVYLDPEVQSQVQEKFENDSEIELQGFLKVCVNKTNKHLLYPCQHGFNTQYTYTCKIHDP